MHEGKECCTIIDNVGLYRRFGLPSADRDWGATFCGLKELSLREINGFRGGWFPSSLWEGGEDRLVKIVSHEGMQAQFSNLGMSGFERRKKGKAWVWKDMMNGVEFERHPKVINYGGMEMSTADGETFFPRIRSKWIDDKHGINRKALETQAGDGIGWIEA